MPPKGHRTISSATPPTCLQASACPNSCRRTIKKRVRYSATFQTGESYELLRICNSKNAMTSQDQCRYTEMPATWKSRNEPDSEELGRDIPLAFFCRRTTSSVEYLPILDCFLKSFERQLAVSNQPPCHCSLLPNWQEKRLALPQMAEVREDS